MSTPHSAGILVYRQRERIVEVFLVHPGGPFWMKKEDAAWSIPKGEYEDGDIPLQAALREFREETGLEPPANPEFLGVIKQAGGKVVQAWMAAGDYDPAAVRSNSFEMEWPKGSGRMQPFPEIDRAAWFDCAAARQKLHKGQVPLIDLLLGKLEL